MPGGTRIILPEEHTIYFSTGCEIEESEIVAEYDQAIDLPDISRPGYLFNGWYASLSDTSPITWQTMPDLTPNTQNNGSTQLHAKWTDNLYYVAYDKNGGSGIMNSSKHIFGTFKQLTANSYQKVGHDFMGWATSAAGSVEYTDEQSVVDLTTTPANTVTLYAVWWPKTYNIIYKNLTQDMSVYPNTYTYGEGLTPMPTIYLRSSLPHYYEIEKFYGWYTNTDFNTKVTSISKTRMGDVILYAKYDYYIGGSKLFGTVTVTDGNINNQPSMNVSLSLNSYYYDFLKNTTLSKIKIEITMDIWEVNDGYQDIYLFNGDTEIFKKTIEHGPGRKDTNPKTYPFTIWLDIEPYKNVNSLDLKFGAHGHFGDTWKFDEFEMKVYYAN